MKDPGVELGVGLLMAVVAGLVGYFLGWLVCDLPYLFYVAWSPPVTVPSVALGLAAAGLALLRPGVGWFIGAGVGVGLGPYVATSEVIKADFILDTTSHNLAPFEIMIALGQGLLAAGLGVLLSAVLRALLGKFVTRKGPWPEAGGIALVMLALGVAAVSARTTASDIRRFEALGLKKVVALIAAQHEFRAAHPLRGYTCDLGELGEPFSGATEKIDRPSAYFNDRVDGVDYYGRSAAIEGEYRYYLMCENKPDPQELFVLHAQGWHHPERPLAVFCAGPDGAIRSIKARRGYCFTDGLIVQSVN